MKEAVSLILENGTEITIEGADRISVQNEYVNYDSRFFGAMFCEGDKPYIYKVFQDFINGRLKEVTAVGTTDPDLTFVLFPRGAKVIREEGKEFYSSEWQYTGNIMKIELDMCINGIYGETFWIGYLNEKETADFINQWLEKIGY